MKYWTDIYKDIYSIKKEITYTKRNSKKIQFLNIPCSFDIETSSFYEGEEKRSIMYIWMFGINHRCYYGREWSEYIKLTEFLVNSLELWENKKLVIYVHNLAFEFQFFRKLFDWKRVFATEERSVVFAEDTRGIDYRCSYYLSNYSLDNVAKNLHTYKIEKLVGNLDYELIRTPLTKLDEKELAYCENDIKIIMYYIQEKLDNGETIENIPYTSTGYVRNYCRNYCYYNNGKRKENRDTYLNFRNLIEGLILTPEEYKELKDVYQGGFTHANPFSANKLLINIGSFDFTSSYPTVMVSEKFPMSRGEKIKIKSSKEFDEYIKKYCCIFELEIFGIEPILYCDNPISISKCKIKENYIENNGRLVRADRILISCTEQDYIIYKKFYKWSKMRIGNFIRYKKGYLPKNLILSVLKLYKDKTELKDIPAEIINYQRSKGMVNGIYGMTVTDIAKDDTIYENDIWSTKEADLDKCIANYNSSKKRFLFYPWGVYITAYARKNLFTGIYEFNTDYIYSDTDSIKVKNINKHIKYIEGYNKMITEKIRKCLEFHKIPFEYSRPKNKKGIEKPLGIWDYEGMYDKFKTLGAKRYMVLKNNEITLTVSGVNKKTASKYMQDKFGIDGAFEKFNDGLVIPADYTGKLTHTYIDEKTEGDVYDYNGKKYHYIAYSGVHLEKVEYSMSLSDSYIDYLLNIKEKLR